MNLHLFHHIVVIVLVSYTQQEIVASNSTKYVMSHDKDETGKRQLNEDDLSSSDQMKDKEYKTEKALSGADDKKVYPIRRNVKVEEQKIGEESFKHVDKTEFPKALKGFGYHFTEDGFLRQISNGERFVFEVRPGDTKYNQAHYEALGDVITEHIYEMLEKRCNMTRVEIPINYAPDEVTSFFFHTEDAFTKPDKLLILIHGSGAVRAGQWARRLIINDCLDSGTQIPFIERGVKDGYGVVVFNTNENRVKVGNKLISPRECGSPESHARYVWEHFIERSPAKLIAIVAHSYGGVVTSSLLSKFSKDFSERVFAIAFTDSVHSAYDLNKENNKWMKKHATNWAASSQPLDTPLPGSDVPRVSAGDTRHEWTSWSSVHSIFKYFHHESNMRSTKLDDKTYKKARKGEL